jgi:flagellar motor component MotA
MKEIFNMKKNIRLVLLGELLLFVVVFFLIIFLSSYELSTVVWFIDLPSLILLVAILIPGLLIMGEWKDFVRSFSVGIKDFSLLELKNIIEAVDAAQKLTVFGALFAIIISGILLLGHLDTPETIGPNLAVCFLSGLYAVIIEFFLLPLRLNAERKMNEEMDLGDE